MTSSAHSGHRPAAPPSHEPERHAIHASLFRPLLVAGAEPTAVILEGMTAGALIFGVGLHVATVALAAFYLVVVHTFMTWVARQDPQMSLLYIRSLTASDYYAPLADVRVRPLAARPAIVGR
jgi:type IV secretory pathway TrbD component